jgi:hypothetical protein
VPFTISGPTDGANSNSYIAAHRPLHNNDPNYPQGIKVATSVTTHGCLQGGDFAQFLPNHLGPDLAGGSNDDVLDSSAGESHRSEPFSGSGQYQDHQSQFLARSSFDLDDGFEFSTSFNLSGAEDEGFQQPVNGFTNDDEYDPLNASVGFSASTMEYGLADTLPGSVTDDANYPEVDGFAPSDTGFYEQFGTSELLSQPSLPLIIGETPAQTTVQTAIAHPLVAAMAAGPGVLAANTRIPCSILGCPVAFSRDSDRIRHEASAHGLNQALRLHLCPILTCPKSQGAGYTRKDKLTEHMWKKHGDLGYVKRVL